MNTDDPQEERLNQLISALFDGELTPADRAELNAALTDAPEARKLYWSWIELHAALHHEAEEFPHIEMEETLDPAAKNRTSPLFWICGIGLAVVLIATILFWFPSQQGETFATIRASDDTRDLRHGQEDIRIASGKVEIRFDSGAIVTLHGSAELSLTSAMRCRLSSGVADVYAPDSAKGFIIDTPWTKVVDLGTHFSVMVDDGMKVVQTRVLEGKVSVSHGDGVPVKVTAGSAINASAERLGIIPASSWLQPPPPLSEKAASVEGFGQKGTVSYQGEKIATWELAIDRLEGFGTHPIVTISTTPHGKFVGVDIEEDPNTGNKAHDHWEFTLKITPVPNAPAQLADIKVLGSNPNFSCRYLGPNRLGRNAHDKLSFNGVGILPGQLSDPTSPDAPNGNLNGKDGETVPLDGSSHLSWLQGDLFAHDWSKHTNWQISFPITPTGKSEAIELTYSADFAGNVWSEGFAFSFTVQ